MFSAGCHSGGGKPSEDIVWELESSELMAPGGSASQTLSRLGEYENSSLGVVKKDGYCSWKSVNVKI